jgi:hypothetical protein
MTNKILEKKVEYLQKEMASMKKLFLAGMKKTNSPQEIVEDFKKTRLYTAGFLKDLGDGLRKSSYGKR